MILDVQIDTTPLESWTVRSHEDYSTAVACKYVAKKLREQTALGTSLNGTTFNRQSTKAKEQIKQCHEAGQVNPQSAQYKFTGPGASRHQVQDRQAEEEHLNLPFERKLTNLYL